MPIDEILRSYLEDSVIENVTKNQVKSDNMETKTNTNLAISADNIMNEESNDVDNIVVEPSVDLFDVSTTLDKPVSNVDTELEADNINKNDNINDDIELDNNLILDPDSKPNVRFSDLDDNSINDDRVKILDDDPNINMNIEDLTSTSIIDDDPTELLGVEVLN